jgi:hypothetical protein
MLAETNRAAMMAGLSLWRNSLPLTEHSVATGRASLRAPKLSPAPYRAFVVATHPGIWRTANGAMPN